MLLGLLCTFYNGMIIFQIMDVCIISYPNKKVRKHSKCLFNVCFSALEDFGLSPRVVDIGEIVCPYFKPYFMSFQNST